MCHVRLQEIVGASDGESRGLRCSVRVGECEQFAGELIGGHHVLKGCVQERQIVGHHVCQVVEVGGERTHRAEGVGVDRARFKRDRRVGDAPVVCTLQQPMGQGEIDGGAQVMDWRHGTLTRMAGHRLFRWSLAHGWIR